MKKRMIAGILFTLCLLILAPGVTFAQTLDPSTLTVVMTYGDEPLDGIHVAICPVADATDDNDVFSLTAVADFAGAGADLNILTKEQNVAVAATLDTYASAHNVARSVQTTNAEGKAVYANLAPGLYLVAQTDGQNSPYEIAPYLVMVPGTDDLSRGFNYNVISYPKTEPVRRNTDVTSVRVFKVWMGTDAPAGPVTAQLFQNGMPYGDAVTLDAASYWSYTWTALPVGYTWTVDELQVPAGYVKTVSGSMGSGFVITNTKTPSPSPSPGKPPKTGDDGNMTPWITLGALSAVGLLAAIAAYSEKKNRQTEK